MRIILPLTLAFVLAACQPEQQAPSQSEAANASAPASVPVPTPAAEAAPALAARSEADRARDAGRKPAEVIEFLGIAPGMTVLDLFAASGWYTEVLAHAVGPDGTVHAQNSAFLLSMRDGANDKAMTERLAGDRLPNVRRLDRELDDLGLAPDSVDAAIFALNFHDVYNSGGADAALGLLRTVYQVLKPGGVLGLIDHSGAAGQDNAALHRIELEKVLQVVAQSDFTVDAQSDLLRNDQDDLQAMVFDPAIRGQTDRFLLRLKK